MAVIRLRLAQTSCCTVCRGVLTEKEKEERRLKRALEKAERELAKHQQREDREAGRGGGEKGAGNAKDGARLPGQRTVKPHLTDDLLVQIHSAMLSLFTIISSVQRRAAVPRRLQHAFISSCADQLRVQQQETRVTTGCCY